MTVTTPATRIARLSQTTFVETALKLSGKSAEEARTTGALDRADEQVETLFAKKYQTTGSPVHRAVWEDELPGDLFVAKDQAVPDATQLVMLKSLETIRERCGQKTVFDAQRKSLSRNPCRLADAGYWGLLVDKGIQPRAGSVSRRSPSSSRRWRPSMPRWRGWPRCTAVHRRGRSPADLRQPRSRSGEYLAPPGDRQSGFRPSPSTEPAAGSDLTRAYARGPFSKATTMS